MKKKIDVARWNRKELYEHFRRLKDPSFAITAKVDVTKAYEFSKDRNISFFGKYLHDCMKAINEVDNLRYRIIDDEVFMFDFIHASATIMREDKTFGFSWITYSESLDVFLQNLENEKQRIQSTSNLFPPINGQNCIHCSAIPWVAFNSHKEPISGLEESIPELAYAKVEVFDGKKLMNVAIKVNHALVDGYHVGQFFEKFQNNLNSLV